MIEKDDDGEYRTEAYASVDDAENIDLDGEESGVHVLLSSFTNRFSIDLIDDFNASVLLLGEIRSASIVGVARVRQCPIARLGFRLENEIRDEISPDLSYRESRTVTYGLTMFLEPD